MVQANLRWFTYLGLRLSVVLCVKAADTVSCWAYVRGARYAAVSRRWSGLVARWRRRQSDRRIAAAGSTADQCGEVVRTRPTLQGGDAKPRARRGAGDSQAGGDMSSAQLYDTIGATYTVTRRTEPRIAARVWAALGDSRTVLNVGAGTGSYEPADRDVTAVEPSALMRAQRPAGAAPCVAAAAESLPFGDQSFDAAVALATIHHWQDPIAGLREMRRVARRVVVFTHETGEIGWLRRFWLTRDYLPEVADLLVGRPSLTDLAGAIGARVEPVLIPWDCADGFFEAYWRRPEAYLDENVRRGVSVWARVGPAAEQRAVHSLRDDLVSGRWAERNRDLVDLDAAELGLRLLIA